MKKFYKKLCIAFIIPVAFAYYTQAQAADYVSVSGRTVGIKIYTDGLVIAGTAAFKSSGGEEVCPARDAGLCAGDIIKSADGQEIRSCEDFSGFETGNEIECEIERGGKRMAVTVTPQMSEDGNYRVGLWARDSTAGIGTLTYVNPENMRYAALGHAVTDVDSGSIMSVERGSIQSCGIISLKPGHIGFPGSVTADFGNEVMGTIDTNEENGVSGEFSAADIGERVPVAEAAEVCDGEAVILSDVEGGEVKEYSARVKVISEKGFRNMAVEITDEHLLSVTGGIIQGMSGAPVMQNGKLIGAVTHVFVNDPKKGYAIFAKNLAE